LPIKCNMLMPKNITSDRQHKPVKYPPIIHRRS